MVAAVEQINPVRAATQAWSVGETWLVSHYQGLLPSGGGNPMLLLPALIAIVLLALVIGTVLKVAKLAAFAVVFAGVALTVIAARGQGWL
jgi:hypothetical protein